MKWAESTGGDQTHSATVAMEVFLFEDVGAEVEVNPDDVEFIKPKRKRTALLKAERKVLVDKLQALDSTKAIASIIKSVDGENHIHLFKQRKAVWNKLLQQNSLLLAIFKGLVETFVHAFKHCEKGKDKFSSSGISIVVFYYKVKLAMQAFRILPRYTSDGSDFVREVVFLRKRMTPL